jgi:hypothetical protein
MIAIDEIDALVQDLLSPVSPPVSGEPLPSDPIRTDFETDARAASTRSF